MNNSMTLSNTTRWFYFVNFFIVFICIANTSVKAQNKGDRNRKRLVNLSAFSLPLSEVEIYSKNIDVKKLEAFDIDKKGNIYYARLGLVKNDKGHEVYLYKAKPNETPKEYMILKYFGHPYNISVEEGENEIYLWISSNGSKHKNGKYWDEPSVSRIKYEPGKTYVKGYGGDTYFLNIDSLQKTQVDINKEKNLMLIAAQSKKRKDWSFYTYDLKEAKALPETLFSFSVTLGGEKDSKQKEQKLDKEIEGRDLSQLTPLGSFTLMGKRAHKPDALNSFWMQGFNIDNNRAIYFYEGEGNRNGRNAQAYITSLDIEGNIIGERTKIKATESQSDLNEEGIIHVSGNLEPEGMTVKEGAIYLGFLAHYEEKNNIVRRSTILKYKNRELKD